MEEVIYAYRAVRASARMTESQRGPAEFDRDRLTQLHDRLPRLRSQVQMLSGICKRFLLSPSLGSQRASIGRRVFKLKLQEPGIQTYRWRYWCGRVQVSATPAVKCTHTSLFAIDQVNWQAYNSLLYTPRARSLGNSVQRDMIRVSRTA